MTEIFIHAGLNKSASTYLQEHFFPLIKDATFFCFHRNLDTGLLREDLGLKKKLIFSDESLLGVPIFLRASCRSEERLSFVRNTKMLFPHAKIILCFREHSAFLISLYKQYLHVGGTLRFQDFFDIANDSGYISKRELFFEERIQMIRENFENEPFIFTDVHLRSHRNKVIKGLLSYVGSSTKFEDLGLPSGKRENRGVGMVQSTLLRQLNRMSASALNPRGLLRLNCRVMRRLRLDPRTLCQDRLRFLSDRELVMPMAAKDYIRKKYANDWLQVLKHVNFEEFYTR
jgi:hypothetical protein|tara:strand:- start:51 stop:911 length:861 start_codon:yes stop_codon:yes gene_type:complete